MEHEPEPDTDAVGLRGKRQGSERGKCHQQPAPQLARQGTTLSAGVVGTRRSARCQASGEARLARQSTEQLLDDLVAQTQTSPSMPARQNTDQMLDELCNEIGDEFGDDNVPA